MSSRSNGVTYCVLSSVMSSRVIASPSVSSALTCSCVIARVRVLAEAALDEPRDLERVLAGLGEEVVELGRPRREREAHGRAR